MNIFPDQPPFLLVLKVSGKVNGGHQLYRICGDTLENVYEGYYDFAVRTYDAHEDGAIYENYELNLTVGDVNKDGFNDLTFSDNLLLQQNEEVGITVYDTLRKIPLSFIFLYDSTTGHFRAVKNYKEQLGQLLY